MGQGFWLTGGSEKLSGKWVTAPSGVLGSRQGHLGSSDTYRLAPSPTTTKGAQKAGWAQWG
jgi:hypothetical protein